MDGYMTPKCKEEELKMVYRIIFFFLRVYILRKMPSCFQQKDYKGIFFKHQRAHVKRASGYLYTNENHVDYTSSKLKIFLFKV